MKLRQRVKITLNYVHQTSIFLSYRALHSYKYNKSRTFSYRCCKKYRGHQRRKKNERGQETHTCGNHFSFSLDTQYTIVLSRFIHIMI